MKSRLIQHAARIAVAVCILVPLARGSSVVVPSADTSTDGNANNIWPFSAGWFGTNSTARDQQVYSAAQFGSAGSTLDIGAIAFRFDSIVAAQTEIDSFASVEIDLSTTPLGPDQLSSTFASNVGTNNAVVYNGPLTLTGTALGQSPNPFNLVINLQTPFLYNTSQGNLLLDIRINGAGSFPLSALDADSTAGDGTSRVWSAFNGSVNDPTGNVDTFGLVTEFLPATTVPEPSSLAMGGLALIAMGLLRRKTRISA